MDEAEYKTILEKIESMNLARFQYKTEPNAQKPHLGLIAEESPEEILGNNGKAISLNEYVTFLLGGIKALNAENQAKSAAIQKLETQLKSLENELKSLKKKVGNF